VGTSDTFDVMPFNIFGVFIIGGNVHVAAQALANRNYQLQASDSPVGAPWSDVGNTAASTANGSVELIDPVATRPQRFYRVRLLP
jgi:hypothetical protein